MAFKNLLFKKIYFVLALLLVSLSYSACPSGIVGYWNFDNYSGNPIYDSINNLDGTVYGATSVSGKVGNAFRFDGVNDKIIIKNNALLNPTSEMTLSVLLNPTYPQDTSTTTYLGILEKDGYSGGKTGYGLVLKAGSDYFRGEFWNPWRYVDSPSGSVNYGQWNHIVVTYKSGEQKIYLNGVLNGSAINTGTINSGNNGVLFIGARGDNSRATFGYFKGLIDEVAIFNRSLNSSEILDLYTKSLNGYGYCSAVVFYSNFTSPETTNFSSVNLSNVSEPILATSQSKIKWFGSYDVEGKDFDRAVKLSHNFVSVDTSLLNDFNSTAEITFYTVTYPSLDSFKIIKNGQTQCFDCIKISSNPVKFRVSHFSNYTTEPSVPEFSFIPLFLILFLSILRKF